MLWNIAILSPQGKGFIGQGVPKGARYNDIFPKRSISIDLNRTCKRVSKSIHDFSRQSCSTFAICNLGSRKAKPAIVFVFRITGSNKDIKLFLRSLMRDCLPNFKDVLIKKLFPHQDLESNDADVCPMMDDSGASSRSTTPNKVGDRLDDLQAALQLNMKLGAI